MLTGDIRGKKIGIPREYRIEGLPAEIAAIWDRGTAMLKDAGAEIVDISLPHEIRAARLLRHAPLPRRRRTSRAMTAYAMATGEAVAGRRHHRDV